MIRMPEMGDDPGQHAMKRLPSRLIRVVCAKCGWTGECNEETQIPCPKCKGATYICRLQKRPQKEKRNPYR